MHPPFYKIKSIIIIVIYYELNLKKHNFNHCKEDNLYTGDNWTIGHKVSIALYGTSTMSKETFFMFPDI